jgi:hypothetical protein
VEPGPGHSLRTSSAHLIAVLAPRCHVLMTTTVLRATRPARWCPPSPKRSRATTGSR